jgi:hypothetical protein
MRGVPKKSSPRAWRCLGEGQGNVYIQNTITYRDEKPVKKSWLYFEGKQQEE